jgi:hypothetical protein
VVSIIFAEEVREGYLKLQKKADKGDGMAKYLISIIDRGVTKLALNPAAGKKIPKRLWPFEYIRKYGVNNLWKLNLDSYWRLIYTLRGDQTEIIGFVLDIMDHKRYSRKFKYKE